MEKQKNRVKLLDFQEAFCAENLEVKEANSLVETEIIRFPIEIWLNNISEERIAKRKKKKLN